ncbi:MAG: diaminopimelate decarboxylase [Bacteroidetes bacterium]|nr:diaminopimelate decarboxylase [Bacteroidota bacterium]MBT3748896.1 diaminopimelate decarboxylase [Bacteroidota bacterium]MBT4398368.1 diaminopimelate decarboxylase [Bacteroidota bacterium]MBT4409411.1 diaminopimelate decarboxylase [Bacteroidota bacterium]MBT5425332.1 diaminopimelate decarboxylase [Bacteroidota bacterium]
MSMIFPLDKIQSLSTPFYYYDMELLNSTILAVKKQTEKHGYHMHYALKANSNYRFLEAMQQAGFGADCVSGNEVQQAINAGFSPNTIAFAGVGKTDKEIKTGLENDIFSFNVESIQEIEVINDLASEMGKTARIALRINPNVDAKTHHYITTGIEENKFGINSWEFEDVIRCLEKSGNLKLTGLHFHIGSQIRDLDVFKGLCLRVNEIQQWFLNHQILPSHINLGGGLGIDYDNPDILPDFEAFFNIFPQFLELQANQQLHFELGRALVAQSGALISRVLFIKNGIKTNFVILDAGMTELIRPALYQSYHKIENLISKKQDEVYDVVGPICESSDCFGKAVQLPITQRGDLFAIRSTGAYGEVMSSQYNLRNKALAYYSDEPNIQG